MKVWVTRDEGPDGPLSTALRAVGLTVIHEPVLERRIVDDAEDAISQLGPHDWLVLTSPYAVEAVAQEAARVPRVAVVSEPSRLAAEARGLRVELVGSEGGAKALFEELRKQTTGGIVCYPRSSLASPPKPWGGVQLLSPVLYETVPRDFDRGVIARVDVVSATSPSAVDAIRAPPASWLAASKLARQASAGCVNSDVHPDGAPQRGLRFASIGPTTSAALRKIGIEPWLEAPQRSFGSLAQAIAAQASDSRHQRA
jgi:uroporphyrinogen-III synthase